MKRRQQPKIALTAEAIKLAELSYALWLNGETTTAPHPSPKSSPTVNMLLHHHRRTLPPLENHRHP